MNPILKKSKVNFGREEVLKIIFLNLVDKF